MRVITERVIPYTRAKVFRITMRYKVKNSDTMLNDRQREIAKTLGISERFLTLLLGRGMSEDNIYDYLHPSLDKMSSPFDIKGMDAATKRVERAINDKEKVLIYGDYDCDGICAISILMLYLRDKLNVTYFIPNRNKDGYGISIDALKGLLARQKPDLVITVDCGITAADEVDYLLSNGVDVIVTDHHEPQERIPNCIVVDAKIERKGFYDFCGAGVALKLVEALAGRKKACEYLDIAAIATIADVVPLQEDNRIIAYYGLKQITANARKGIRMLLGQERVSSQDVMFRLAPRMNAAGRLNSAMKVVGLFLETDYFMLKSLSEELARDNTVRQELCEKVVDEAKSMLRGHDFNTMRIIALRSDKWEAGVLGIAAARLVDEFKRPTVLFSQHGEDLKGSARSVSNVNIFELFNSLSQYFTAFGGHAQAAGVSMKESDLNAFVAAANERLSARPISDFIGETVCEMTLDSDTDFLSFAKELEMMEPTGYGNPRPNFLFCGSDMKFERIGFSDHVKCVLKNIDIMGFTRFSDSLCERIGDIGLEMTLGTNCFQNIVSAQGIIQSMQIDRVRIDKDASARMNAHQLTAKPDKDFDISSVQRADIKDIVTCLKKPFGTLLVCFDQSEYESIISKCDKAGELPVSVATLKCLNPENGIVISPANDFDFSFYDNVFICGSPLCNAYLAHIVKCSNKCFILNECVVKPCVVSDDTLRSVYKELLKISSKGQRISNMKKLYVSVCSGYKVSEDVFEIAYGIFAELGLVDMSDRGILSVSRKSVRLSDSVIYNNLSHD